MPRNDEVTRLLGSDYGEVLWEPAPEVVEQARITQYLRWLAEHHGVAAADYTDLWEWSAGEPGAFWDSLWEYFGVLGQRGDGPALSGQLPGASWFPGATLNYARNALRTARTDPGRVAIIACGEDAPPRTFTYGELAAEVGRVRGALRALGVGQGDRVAAFLPNIPEALIGLLATASLGAIWSSCSPDFGAHSVIDRFAQIRPTVLLAVGSYRYGGKEFSRDEAVGEIVAGLPGLAALIMVDRPGAASPDAGSPGAGVPDRGLRHWDRPPGRPPARRGYARSAGLTCRPRPGTASRNSWRSRSITRSGCCTRPAPPACLRRSCMVTAASSSSTSRRWACTRISARATCSSGTPPPAG